MNWKRIVMAVVVLLVVFVAWLGRYEIIGVPAGGQGVRGVAYRLDRWTGEVVVLHDVQGIVVKIERE